MLFSDFICYFWSFWPVVISTGNLLVTGLIVIFLATVTVVIWLSILLVPDFICSFSGHGDRGYFTEYLLVTGSTWLASNHCDRQNCYCVEGPQKVQAGWPPVVCTDKLSWGHSSPLTQGLLSAQRKRALTPLSWQTPKKVLSDWACRGTLVVIKCTVAKDQ